jgi:hypothetical protein
MLRERLRLQIETAGYMRVQPWMDQGFGGGVYSMRRGGVCCRHNVHRVPNGIVLPYRNDNPYEVPSETIRKPNESAYGVVHRTLWGNVRRLPAGLHLLGVWGEVSSGLLLPQGRAAREMRLRRQVLPGGF